MNQAREEIAKSLEHYKKIRDARDSSCCESCHAAYMEYDGIMQGLSLALVLIDRFE